MRGMLGHNSANQLAHHSPETAERPNRQVCDALPTANASRRCRWATLHVGVENLASIVFSGKITYSCTQNVIGMHLELILVRAGGRT
jgi:hypothetical protein